MRRILPIAIFLAALAGARADSLVFLNGDRINGTFLEAKNPDTILWRFAPDTGPVEIPTASVHRISFDPGSEIQPSTQHEISLNLQITNGNNLHGRFVAVEEDAVGIASDIFGSLRVPRTMIESIHINQGGYYLLASAGAAREWTINRRRSWGVRDEILTARDYGTIAREIPSDRRIRIQFEVSGDDPSAGLTLHFFVANPARVNSDAHYSVQFSGNFAYARRTVAQEREGRNAARISTESIGEPQSYNRRGTTSPMQVTLFADARRGSIILHIDGREVATWQDPRGLGEPYGGIGFSNNNQNITTIRNLSVSRWQGLAELPPEIPEGVDVTILRNEDILEGSVLGLRDGSLEIDSPLFGPLKVPNDRIHNIVLSTQTRERPRYLAGDARISFHRGGELTLQIHNIANGRITGFSELCGQATVDLAGVQRIQFLHAYEELLDSPDNINTSRPESLLESRW